jgi:RNA 2',3'-cyclic 3'-phosphodiesterase
MERTLRAFVAFKLPEHVMDRAAALQGALKASGLKLQWVKPQNLHLTLKFLGDIPEADVSKVGAAIDHVVGNEPPLEMTLQGMGAFPGIKRPRVLWVGFGGHVQDLKRLHLKLEDQLDKIGFDRDKRGFKAHLTIARIKRRVAPERLLDAIKALGDFPPHSFVARKMVLYKSDLRTQGAVYTPLAEAELGEPSA